MIYGDDKSTSDFLFSLINCLLVYFTHRPSRLSAVDHQQHPNLPNQLSQAEQHPQGNLVKAKQREFKLHMLMRNELVLNQQWRGRALKERTADKKECFNTGVKNMGEKGYGTFQSSLSRAKSALDHYPPKKNNKIKTLNIHGFMIPSAIQGMNTLYWAIEISCTMKADRPSVKVSLTCSWASHTGYCIKYRSL